MQTLDSFKCKIKRLKNVEQLQVVHLFKSYDMKGLSLNHLLLRFISTLLKLEISTLLKTITNSWFQALEGLKFQTLEGLKFQNKRTQKQMTQTIKTFFSCLKMYHFRTSLPKWVLTRQNRGTIQPGLSLTLLKSAENRYI